MLIPVLAVTLASVVVAYDVGECESPLAASLPDSAFSASSHWPADFHMPHYARIYNQDNYVWASAGPSDSSPYLQLTFLTPKTIRKVATSGRPNSNQFVMAYTLSYSTDGSTFFDYKPYKQSSVVFQGNVEAYSVKENWLPTALSGVRAIRIHPLTYNKHASMKAEVYGC